MFLSRSCSDIRVSPWMFLYSSQNITPVDVTLPILWYIYLIKRTFFCDHSLLSFLPHTLIPLPQWGVGIRLQEVMFNGFWDWRTFQRLMLPGRLTYHRFQEVPDARSYLPCLALQAHPDLLESHHGHLWQFQELPEDLWIANSGWAKGKVLLFFYCFCQCQALTLRSEKIHILV